MLSIPSSMLFDTSFIVFPEVTVEPPPPPIRVKTTYFPSQTVPRVSPSPTHPRVTPSLSLLSPFAEFNVTCKEAPSEPLVMELIKMNLNCMFKFISEFKRHFFPPNIVLYCFHCKCLFVYNEFNELLWADLGIHHCL